MTCVSGRCSLTTSKKEWDASCCCFASRYFRTARMLHLQPTTDTSNNMRSDPAQLLPRVRVACAFVRFKNLLLHCSHLGARVRAARLHSHTPIRSRSVSSDVSGPIIYTLNIFHQLSHNSLGPRPITHHATTAFAAA